MVNAISPVNVSNDNYGTKAVKYGTIAGLTGATIAGAVGSFTAPHWNFETNQLTDKFVRQVIGNLDDGLLDGKAKVFKDLFKLDPVKTTTEAFGDFIARNRNFFEETADVSFEEAKKMAMQEVNNDAKVLEAELKKLQKGSLEEIKSILSSGFDENGFFTKANAEIFTEEQKSMVNSVKKTLRQMQLKTAGKWALIGGGILGGIGLAIGACNKKEAPKTAKVGFEATA